MIRHRRRRRDRPGDPTRAEVLAIGAADLQRLRALEAGASPGVPVVRLLGDDPDMDGHRPLYAFDVATGWIAPLPAAEPRGSR